MNFYLYLLLCTFFALIGLNFVIKNKKKNPKSKIGLIYVLSISGMIYYSKFIEFIKTTPLNNISADASSSSSITSVFPLSSN